MYHADLIGGITAHFFAGVPVIWNLRQSTFDSRSSKKTTIRSARLCAKLSNRLPHTIVCGSNAAHESHVKFGYSPDRMVVVPNGFDTAAFLPNPRYRSDVLRELGLGDEAFLVGLVARFDPQKDHRTFFTAAAQVAHQVPHARFALCGEGIDDGNPDLLALIHAHGLQGRTHLLGLRNDLASFYPGLDVLALSSAYGEGAPAPPLAEAAKDGLAQGGEQLVQQQDKADLRVREPHGDAQAGQQHRRDAEPDVVGRMANRDAQEGAILGDGHADSFGEVEWGV
jgi:glycosyltransferase involved in cell wall biosynthesis